MKLFLDTEFTGLRQDTTLISLALVSEEGHSFYAEFCDYAEGQIKEQEIEGDFFIRENVIKNLKFKDIIGLYVGGNSKQTEMKGDSKKIELELRIWLQQFDEIEIWSDVLNYDWTLFRELFYNQLPENIYYIPFDLATAFKMKGIDPDISRKEFAGIPEDFGIEHNALSDANLQRLCYERLNM